MRYISALCFVLASVVSIAHADTVVISVMDVKGQPIAGAEVQDAGGTLRSNAQGLLQIDDISVDMTEISLTLAHPDYVPQPVHVILEEGVASYRIPVIMPEGARVSGQIVGEAGLPLAGARVSIFMDSPPGIQGFRYQRTQADEQGHFDVGGIVSDAAGDIRIVASARNYQDHRGTHALDELGNAPLLITLEPLFIAVPGAGDGMLLPRFTVTGRVHFVSDAPPSSGVIRFVPGPRGCSGFYPRETAVDEYGSFHFNANGKDTCQGVFVYEVTENLKAPGIGLELPSQFVASERKQSHGT